MPEAQSTAPCPSTVQDDEPASHELGVKQSSRSAKGRVRRKSGRVKFAALALDGDEDGGMAGDGDGES
jgi:hypothetical protein